MCYHFPMYHSKDQMFGWLNSIFRFSDLYLQLPMYQQYKSYEPTLLRYNAEQNVTYSTGAILFLLFKFKSLKVVQVWLCV